MTGARTLYVMAKQPRPGRSKTRLCPRLSLAQAAECAQAMLGDLLAELQVLPEVRCVLAAADRADARGLEEAARRHGFSVAVQVTGDLGARMRALLEEGTREAGLAVVVGADCPELGCAQVLEAFDALATVSTVIAPATDGGYVLLGCRGRPPDVFALTAAWGSGAVLAETRLRLDRAGNSYKLLAECSDIDTFEDLAAFAGRLRREEALAKRLPRTCALIERLGLEGTQG